jgi:hypothetical protein
MQHEPWPSLPPGGHRPPDYPPFTSPGDQLLAVGLGTAAGAGALVWATGQAAGLAFGHTWLELSPGDVAHILWHLPQHWSDPARAWPADVRGPLPGPVGMYATFTGLIGGLAGGTAAALRHLPGRATGHRPGHLRPAKHAAAWANGRELRLLTVREPEPGRVILGRTPGVFGRLLAAEDCHSVLVFGPTGSYKTSALVIPGVLEWSGPLLATSVKPDLLRATLAYRARLGQVLVIDPLGASGVQAAKWSPLASCATWAGAQQMAVMLANAIEQTPTEEQRPEHRFWKTMGTKFLAPMLFAAAVKGLSMAEVLHWLDSREDQQIKDILDAAGVPAALDAWESSQYRTDRAVDSLYATAEEVLHVYGNERVAASTEATTWTSTTSSVAITRSICTPRPTSSGCCGRCSRRSPSRSWPPPRSGPPWLLMGCFSRGWGCSWTRPATAPPSPTWMCWPPPPAAKASSWSRCGMTRASSRPATAPRPPPS